MGYGGKQGEQQCIAACNLPYPFKFNLHQRFPLPLHRNGTMRPSLLQIVLLLWSAIALASSAECPPKGFDSVKDFDVKKYVSAPWYIQEQVRPHLMPAWQRMCPRQHCPMTM